MEFKRALRVEKLQLCCNDPLFLMTLRLLIPPKAAPLYQEALSKSGYKHKLEFNPSAGNTNSRSKNRKRNITWFNPPFSQNVKTNVGEKFLKLVDQSFPPNHPLRQICNRNTLKLSYRCTPNIGSFISAKNAKLLQPKAKPNQKQCNCKGDKVCPVDGKGLSESVIYRATLTEENGTIKQDGMHTTILLIIVRPTKQPSAVISTKLKRKKLNTAHSGT